MAKNFKQSTLDAMNKYSQRQLDEAKPKPVRHNEKPEKEVEKACLELMRSWGWSVQIFESKATWSPSQQCWVQQGMKVGTCDCLGSIGGDIDPNAGIACAIEFKAAGKLSTFNKEKNFAQRKFIIDKINANNFACVVDSAERLKLIYTRWADIKINSGINTARAYLISMLPVASEKTRLKEDKLFDDE